MAKIERRERAPPENMLTMPRMVLERSPKKRATSAGLMPGTGMKVPMRYTISAPIRNRMRVRISPKRAASPSVAAGLLNGVFAMAPRVLPLLDLPARGLDRGTCALGDRNALERDGLLELPGQHHLGALGGGGHYAGFFERLEVDHLAPDLGELMQPDFGAAHLHVGAEADLRHAPLQRHLAAFEADFVVAALAGALALGAAAAGLALAGGSAASHAQPRTAGAGGGFQCIESHGVQAPFRVARLTAPPLSTSSRCTAAWIMPRFSGVSATVTHWRMRRRPSPRAEAAMLASCPCRLFTSVTLICLSLMVF